MPKAKSWYIRRFGLNQASLVSIHQLETQILSMDQVLVKESLADAHSQALAVRQRHLESGFGIRNRQASLRKPFQWTALLRGGGPGMLAQD